MKHVGAITPDMETVWRHGRVGICLLALGFYLMRDGASLLCPRKDMPGSIWKPGYWQRRHVMYTSMILFVILLLALEFSFSKLFSMSPIGFMLLFKVVWMYMEVWLLKALTEKMIALPFECGLQTIQFVMTLGATSFLDFIYATLVELGVMVFMRAAVVSYSDAGCEVCRAPSPPSVRALLTRGASHGAPLLVAPCQVQLATAPQVQGRAAECRAPWAAGARQHA